MDNTLANNTILLEGTILTKLEFSHEMYGEKFYSFNMGVKRLSETSDDINVLISERIFPKVVWGVGTEIFVTGQLRSYNKIVDGVNRLILTVFAKNITLDFVKAENPNQIFLNGFICKPPIYRTTPFGKEITDILIAVNRQYNKSDYIPVIAWGRNAKYSRDLLVGDNITLEGRIQSREYEKKISIDEVVKRTAFEVSISIMEKIIKEEKIAK